MYQYQQHKFGGTSKQGGRGGQLQRHQYIEDGQESVTLDHGP